MAFEPLFSKAADAYRVFRPPYPDALFERILNLISPANRACAMDLGAGTGFSAIPLCKWFSQVIAVEPDAQMAAHLVGCQSNLVVRNSSAEECLQDPQSVDLITCGTSFHWMDGPRVLANALRWLRPSGILAVYHYWLPKLPPATQALFDCEMALHWRHFRHNRLGDEDYTRRTISACPSLDPVQIVAMPNLIPLECREFVGFCRSTSYVSRFLHTLEEPEAYLHAFEAAVRMASGDEPVHLHMPIELILARSR